MARDIADALKLAQGRLHEGSPWIWLYELEIPTTPPTRYRLTNFTQKITFGTSSDGVDLVYYPAAVTHTIVRQTNEGDIPTLTVTVGNVDNVVGATVESYDGLRGQPARIMAVHADSLQDPNAKIEFRLKVARVGISQEAATFELRPIAVASLMFPAWRYLSRSCRFAFGDNLCGYVIPSTPGESIGSGFSTCDKTIEQCNIRGQDESDRNVTVLHPLHYGGFQGLVRS